MKKSTTSGKGTRCLLWYGASLLGLLVGSVLTWLCLKAGYDLPGWGIAAFQGPGCAAGLRGWGLLTEAKALPPERRSDYGPLPDWPAVRKFPFLYLFGILIALLCG